MGGDARAHDHPDLDRGQIPGPLPGSFVLGAEEITTIRTAITAFNEIIAAEAHRHGAGLVDIHRRLDTARKRGIVVGGQRRLTTDFLGGLFSLDGVHPTNTGYAIVANEFIKTLNRRFAAGLPPGGRRAGPQG